MHAMGPKVFGVLTLTFTCLVVTGQSTPDLVKVNWGVADATATVGRLFRMHIPSDAFSGPVKEYQVKTTDGQDIPGWLLFDSTENVLQGIPTPKDVGQMFLDITAKGSSNEASWSSTLVVRDVPSHTSGAPLKFKKSGPEYVRCKRHEPETVATIILDVELEGLDARERLSLMKRFLGHMDLHDDMVKLLPVGQSPMHDSSALVSGSGDCVSPKTSGTFMSWPVGCGQVKSGHFPILQRLDDDSGSGRMAEVLKHSIIGWHVTNSHMQAPKRKRRQALVTATAVSTPDMPTKTKTDDTTDDTKEKMTRTVIDMASPTMIQPTATQPEMPKTEDPVMPVKPPVKPSEVVPPVVKPEKTPTIEPTMTYTDDGGATTEPPVVDTCVRGERPQLKNTFKKLTFIVGDIIDFVIPEDVFVDCEVGGTRGLELFLFKDQTNDLPEDFFLQLDKVNQKIIGLPMEDDVRKYKLNLIGKKPNGGTTLINNFDFIVNIRQKKSKFAKSINHELSVAIDLDYKKFKSSISNQTALATKIASIYGDPDASNMVITTLKEGSVIYGWANKSVASGDCPVGAIGSMVNKLVNEDGTLNKEAEEKLKPFKMIGMSAQPAESCIGNPDFPVKEVMRKKPEITTKPAPTTKKANTTKGPVEDDSTVPSGNKKAGINDDDDNTLITTVLPAIVIVVILLLALLIACILYRKKRKGKMNVEEQNTFVNKGAPVIFPDELEDKPNDVNKPLLVEGNASPPPQYRGPNGSPERDTTPNNHVRSHANNVNSSPHDDDIQEYEPPTPPVTGSANNRQPRPSHQHQPLSQPPQILP